MDYRIESTMILFISKPAVVLDMAVKRSQLLPVVLVLSLSTAYVCLGGGGAFAAEYPAPDSGTVHIITPADFRLGDHGLLHSCPAVICPGYERENTSDRQFAKYEISTKNVADGDTVIFEDGTYDIDGPIVIRHTDLTISSDDGDGVLIRSTDNKGLIFRNFGDVSGLEIRGFYMASAETTRLAPARNFAMVFIEDTAGLDDIKILDNTFRGDEQNGIRIGSSDQSSLFTNVEIRDNSFQTIPADRTPVHLSNTEVTLFANTFERSDYVHHDGAGSLIDLYNVYPGKPDRAPVVTPPPAVELEATGPLTAVASEQLGTATARDDRDQSPVITNDSPGSFTVGNHTVTWTATDDAGNAGTAAQRVTIRDTTPPAITLPGDIKVTVEMGVTPEELRSAVAATCTDLVDGDLPITSNGVVDPDTPGEYVVEQSCTDAAGNPASVTRTVTVAPPAQPLPQPTDLGLAKSYDMGKGWRMMSINWTEPGQPPASGYEVTVTGSNGTLLPLSQFNILSLEPNRDTQPQVRSYNMDGSRNFQVDFKIPRHYGAYSGIDIHDNVVYLITYFGNYFLLSLNGTQISSGQVPLGMSGRQGTANSITVYDGKMWIADNDDRYHDYNDGIVSYDLDSKQAVRFEMNERLTGITELGGMLYAINSTGGIHVYDTDGTYLPDKSFVHHINYNLPYGTFSYHITAEKTTGTLWVSDSVDYSTSHSTTSVYSAADDGTHSMLFSLDFPTIYDTKEPAYLSALIAFTTTVTSDTITVPAGTNRTVYYYSAPANETVTHTVQLATPSSEPPATIQTRGNEVIRPPAQVFYNTFDSSLGTWTYQERPYGSLNTMFCDDDITGTYTLAHSADNGGSAHVARANVTDMCWFGSAGLARTFDVPAGYGGGDLTIRLIYKSQAGLGLSLIEFICSIQDFCTGGQDGLGAQGAATDMADAAAHTGPILGRHANNLFYAVTDSADNDLANGQLFPGDRSVPKVGASWNTAAITVPSLDAAACPCKIAAYTTDLDWDVFNKRFHIDNVNATMTAP